MEHADPLSYYNEGCAKFSSGDFLQAVELYRKALEHDPSFFQARYNYGVSLQQLHRYAEAEQAYRDVLASNPEYFDALTNLVVVLRRQDKLEESIQTGLIAVRATPSDPANWNNLGLALYENRMIADAILCFENAIKISPDPAYWNNLGLALYETRTIADAILCFENAIKISPDYADAHWNLASALLLVGDTKRGWNEFEWRMRIQSSAGHFPSPAQPMWSGEDLTGKTLFVFCEQGLGDTLHFIRYIRRRAFAKATLIVACQPEVIRLLQDSYPDIQFFVRGTPHPDFDYWIPLMSLPRLLDSEEHYEEQPFPYLHPTTSDHSRLSSLVATDQTLKVGLVWAGSPRKDVREASRIDRRRSIKFEMLSPILETKGITFFSFQLGEAKNELETSACKDFVIDLSSHLSDFADTAAFLSEMDLLISVDTSTAHAAGAIGLPVWMLSRFDGCWRWHESSAETHWYPTMVIYHQKKAYQWDDVIQKVSDDLRALTSLKRAPHAAHRID